MAISPGGRPADASSLDSSPRSNWVEKVGGLPRYVRMVANALVRKGMPKDRAIPTAINMMKKWAAGSDNVTPKVQAAAAAALAEWNAKKGATLSLANPARVDVGELLDLAIPAATLEWALEALDLSDDDHDAVLDLAEPAVLDLAPGDYRPPYDWKHGFIPLTPAAAAVKAGKGPAAGKGRAKPPKGKRVAGAPSSKAAARAATKKAAQARLAKARDDEQRGRATPGEAQAAQNAVNASGTRGNAGPGMRTTSTSSGDFPATRSEQAGQRAEASSSARRLTLEAAANDPVVSGEARRAIRDRVLPRANQGRTLTSDDAMWLRMAANAHAPGTREHERYKAAADAIQGSGSSPVRTSSSADGVRKSWPEGSRGRFGVAGNEGGVIGTVVGHTDTGMVRVRYKTERGDERVGTFNPSQARKTNALGPKWTPDGKGIGTGPDTPPDADQQARADAERKAQESAAGKPRVNTPGGGSYPVKADGSPDYGAMSAEQAATIRARQSGRGVGQTVDTDQGRGTVTAVTSRGTTVDLDNGGKVNIVAGTPGHDRIKPAGKDTDRRPTDPISGRPDTALPNRSDESATDRRAQERAIERKDYANADGPALADEVARRGLMSKSRALGKSDAQLRGALKRDDAGTQTPNQRKADADAASKAQAARSTSSLKPGDMTDDELKAEKARVQALRPDGVAGQRIKRNRMTAVEREQTKRAREAQRAGRSAGASESGQQSTAEDVSNWNQGVGRSEALRDKLKADGLLDDNGKVTAKGARRGVTGPTTDQGARDAVPATPGGITEATAKRMSDEQLERAMARLMAAQDYNGPAFKIIERELNRRDAEGNRRGR